MAGIEEVSPIINIIDPPGSDNDSDEDAVNTAGSRVYMGPLMSPEKKLASQIVLPTPRRSKRTSTSVAQSPLRRSSRLSSARGSGWTSPEDQQDLNLEVADAVNEGSSTGEDTPDKDGYVDDGEFFLLLWEDILKLNEYTRFFL